MAIVVRYPTSELTAENYNSVNKALTDEMGSDPPEGLELHVCFGEDGDLKISEIWSSKEQWEGFVEKLRPVLESQGIEMKGEPEVYEVENMLKT